MKKRLNMNNQLLILLLLGISLLCSPTRVSTTVIWEENFEGSPDDWSLSYWNTSSGVFVKQPEPGFTIQNGILTAPNDRTFDMAAFAYRNSSVAYGTWAFDWVVEPGTDHCAYDVISLLGNDSAGDYDPSGETWDEYLANDYTYNLGMSSSSATGGAGTWVKPGLNFVKRAGGGDTDVMLGKYQFANDITGIHRVEVTRDNSGKFRIYFDDTFLFSAIDNEFKTSEVFFLGSAKGDSGFDNITITNNPIVDTHAPTISSPVHSPQSPNASQTLGISVLVEDDFGLASVEVFYRVDATAWTSTPMSHISYEYYDVMIGPFSGSSLEYYIKAIDTSSNEANSSTITVTLDEGPITTKTTTMTASSTTTTTTGNGTPGFSNLLLLSTSITLVYLLRHRKKRRT
ncbi:MAG: hypothetical protein ACFFAU_18030 [Candidatus Hodarchaeota archaeon]